MSATLPQNFRGGLFMVLAMGSFVASDSFLKLAFGRLPTMELMALRGALSSLLCLGLILALGQSRQLKEVANPWSVLRASCEVVASLLYVWAIFHMPIADVASIMLIAPFIVIAGSALIYNTSIDRTRLALVALGLIGALLVAQPGSSTASPYAILGFLGAMAVAVRELLARKVPSQIPGLIVALTVLVCITLATTIGTIMFENPIVPVTNEAAFAAVAGVLAIAGQFSVYIAYKIGPAQRVAPFMYSLMIWAIVLGYVFAGNVPNTIALTGMAVIAAAGLILIRIDNKKAVATS